MQTIVGDRITVSTVLIAGHAGPETMISIAEQGRGRFYNVHFARPAAADFHQGNGGDFEVGDFRRAVQAAAAVVERSDARHRRRRVSAACSATWPRRRSRARRRRSLTRQGRSVAGALAVRPGPRGGVHFGRARRSGRRTGWAGTSTASSGRRSRSGVCAAWRTRTSRPRSPWTKARACISVEALDEKGNYRNFLNLQTVVVSPKGERQTVRLEQTGPGHYEAQFPTKEVGAYLLEPDGQWRTGRPVAGQVVGASVNYSPEFTAGEPNANLLRRIAESRRRQGAGSGQIRDGQSVHP